MKYEQQIPRIVIIGVIWGLVEIFVAPLIKLLQPALFGMLMPFITTIIILVARHFVPYYGSTILMGIIAAVIKYLLSGMILHGAFMAILLEALCAEVILSILKMNSLSYILVGVSIELYSAIHPILSKGLFCQSAHYLKFKRILLDIFAINPNLLSKNMIGLILIITHILLGILAGLLFIFIRKYLISNSKYSSVS